jgi:uncharacterized RDD family membrane protein YckC
MTDGAPGAGSVALATPGLARRLACFVYEGVLLFGVLMISGYLYSSLSQQRNALHGRHGLQAFLFVVLGIYFVWFWSRGGQTVAMKAWHIRLLGRDGTPLTQARALARYLLAWLWFMPALLALAWLDRDRQFLHDRLCGTRLVDWHPDATARDRARGTGQNRAP